MNAFLPLLLSVASLAQPATDRDSLLRKAAEHVRAAAWDKAIETFAAVLRADPRCADAWDGRSSCWLTKGESEQALSDFSAAVSLEPKNPRFIGNRAAACVVAGEWTKAIDDFNDAIRLDA